MNTIAPLHWPALQRVSAIRLIAAACALAIGALHQAGAIAANPVGTPAKTISIATQPRTLVAERNFPLLEFIASNQKAREAITENAIVRQVVLTRSSRVSGARSTCKVDAKCLLGAWLWTADEITMIGTALKNDRQFAKHTAEQMRASGMFAKFATLNDSALIEQGWRTTVEGINHVIRTYGLGTPPRYAAIDSIAFEPTDAVFAGLVVDAVTMIEADMGQQIGGIFAAERLALDLLYVNERENAGFFPNLDAEENAAARISITKTAWNDFPYSLILVLGDGPDDVGKQLGSYGKLRLQHAASLYRDGMAPFLVVSGGNVHPARTPHNEALEMKRELIRRYDIPEAAIIMEPYARHTTTNFRNTARLMIRYRFPLDKDALVTTSSGHSLYAGGPLIQEKAMTELGYSPMKIIRRLGPFDLVFRAETISTHRDPGDPLDP